MVEILRRMGPDPTRADITRTAMTIHDLDLGTGEKLSFGGADNARQASHKVYFTIVRDGRFVPFNDADWAQWAKP